MKPLKKENHLEEVESVEIVSVNANPIDLIYLKIEPVENDGLFSLENKNEPSETLTWCCYCDTNFSTFHQLRKHYNKQHPEVKNIKIKDQFKEQINNIEQKCLVPNTNNSIVQTIIKKNKLLCIFCANQTFLNKHSLIRHYSRMHKQVNRHEIQVKIVKEECLVMENPLQCQHCGALSKDKVSLRKHVEAHKPFVCQICGSSYGKKDYLDDHMKKHKDPTYKCQLCPMAFHSRSSLSAHNKSHSKSKQYICNICGDLLRYRSSLATHISCKHSDIKPHKCEICKKEFSLKSSLKKHVEVLHAAQNQALHDCERCKNRYKTESTLIRHFKMRHQEFLFNCTNCDKSYISTDDLNSHLKNKHGVV